MNIKRAQSFNIIQKISGTKKIEEDEGHIYFEIYTSNGIVRSISAPDILSYRKTKVINKKGNFNIKDYQNNSQMFAITRILCSISHNINSHILLGKDNHTGNYIVIKLVKIAENILEIQKFQNQVKNEIKILSQIKHKNIIEYYGYKVFLKTVCIYLEYFKGTDLFYILQKNKKVPIFLAIKVFKELVEAISYLHKNRICHLDIKPENILVNIRQQTIKLIDFGMAQKSLKSGLVKAYGGSMNYASPEAVEGGIYNGFLADSWSCGIVLFLMVNGHFPSVPNIVSQPDVPEKVIKILESLLKISPEKRQNISHIDINQI